MSGFLMSLKDVTLAFGGAPVLDGVSLSLAKGLRAALTGRNGEGKSTLMRVLAGELEPDTGEVVRAPGLRVVYVSQAVPADRPGDAAFNALSGGKRRRRILEDALVGNPDLLLLDEPTNHLDVEAIDWLEGCLRRAREMAVLLVTHDRRFLKRVATKIYDLDRGRLSGWECDYATFVRRKAELAADEAVYWERKSRKLAQEEAWIRRGVKARTTRNEGRVEALRQLRAEFAARRVQAGRATMRLDTAAPGGVSVLKVKNLCFGYGAKDREETGLTGLEKDSQDLSRAERVETHGDSSSSARLNPVNQPENPVHPVFLINDFTTTILRGERIGILGRNGAGKTTLLNLLTGRLKPTSGSVTVGTGVEMAFFDQLRSEMKPDLTVAENLASDRDEVVVGGVRKHVYSYLADFLFSSERARTPVRALSGGERARLMLAKLFLKPANLLVMDEPTNDLDIETLELLEEQLLAYKGTLLLVSHDREFLDNVVTSTFALEGDGEVRCYPGGWEDYLSQRAVPVAKGSGARDEGLGTRGGQVASRPFRAEEKSGASAPSPQSLVPNPSKKLSYKEQRELAQLPKRIEALEKEIADIRTALADGSLFRRDPSGAKALTERLPQAEAELEAAVERWAELEERNQ